METNFTTGTLQTMPFYPPRQIIELEIDAQGANYDSIQKGVKKICADHKQSELHLKVFNLSPVYDAPVYEVENPKKSEMACNCCGDCGEARPLIYAQTEDIDAISKVIDFLLAEMSKLANQKKF